MRSDRSKIIPVHQGRKLPIWPMLFGNDEAVPRALPPKTGEKQSGN
jgi:hypothetical protein